MSNKLSTLLKKGTENRPLFGDKPAPKPSRPWKLLIVDDEPEVHSVTRLALSDFRYDGRGLDFISAYSGAQAREMAANDPEIAVMLLDVVMETDNAGLEVVQYVRQILGNNFVRIILRTGHPGLAPERAVIKAYDINDYRAKTELTQDRMFSLMYTSLAAYKRLTTLARSRRHLAALADEYRRVLDRVAVLVQQPTDEISRIVAQIETSEGAQMSAEALPELQRACTRLSRVAGSLSRLSALADIDESMVDFKAEEAISRVLARLDAVIQERGAQISVGSLPIISGYVGLFEDLMEQLLLNALQAHPDETPGIEVSAESSGKDWKFIIADRGRGVPADQAESVFQAFSGDVEDGPLGMGLALCRKIVALHGGRIWVEPRPGGGALFMFTLAAGGLMT